MSVTASEWVRNLNEKVKPQIMHTVRGKLKQHPELPLTEKMFIDAFDDIAAMTEQTKSHPVEIFFLMRCLCEAYQLERSINPCPQPDPLTT